MNVHFDCALLAVPNFAVSGEEADLLFERVQHFAAISLPDHPARILLRDDVEEFLWSKRCGPDFDQIGGFIDICGLRGIYATNDLLRLYNQVISSAERFRVSPEQADGNGDQLVIRPDLRKTCTPQSLADRTKENIAWIATECTRIPRVLASPFADLDVHHFELVDETNGRKMGEVVIAIPEFGSAVELARTVWDQAADEDDMALAVALGAARIASMDSSSVLRKFAFSSGFLESLKSQNAVGDGKNSQNIRAILCELVAGVCGNDRHAYGLDEPLVRDCDGARAHRLHVTKRHEALRLMFWEREGYIEFANLATKADIRILGSTAAASRSWDSSRILDP